MKSGQGDQKPVCEAETELSNQNHSPNSGNGGLALRQYGKGERDYRHRKRTEEAVNTVKGQRMARGLKKHPVAGETGDSSETKLKQNKSASGESMLEIQNPSSKPTGENQPGKEMSDHKEGKRKRLIEKIFQFASDGVELKCVEIHMC